MNLKKGLSILLCFILMYSIVGCNKFDDNNMTIEKSKLSKDEKNIFELTKVNTSVEIWDYDVDETIKSISFNCYELDENNKWQAISGGGSLLAEAKQGRISLAFDKILDGIKISIQGKNGTISSSHESENSVDLKSMSYTTSFLSSQSNIEIDKEIPIAIQIFDSDNEIFSGDVNKFYEPNEFEKYNYDHVYAVTITFSQVGLE